MTELICLSNLQFRFEDLIAEPSSFHTRYSFQWFQSLHLKPNNFPLFNVQITCFMGSNWWNITINPPQHHSTSNLIKLNWNNHSYFTHLYWPFQKYTLNTPMLREFNRRTDGKASRSNRLTRKPSLLQSEPGWIVLYLSIILKSFVDLNLNRKDKELK